MPAFNMDPKKHPMPSQDPLVRNKNFKEVALGYDEATAIEALRGGLSRRGGHPRLYRTRRRGEV